MLYLQNFAGLVQSMGAAAQGACAQLLDFTVGSVSLALTEACAAMGLWLQWLIVLLMNRQRLATCFGTDVDTFINQYNFYRLPGLQASGTVTLARYSTTNPATVLVGTQLLSGDGSTTFQIIADPTNALWNSTLTNPAGVMVGGFVIPSGTASANFMAQAVSVGTAGNASAGAVSLLGTAVSGVDTVINAAPFVGGFNTESDAAVKTRFALYFQSLSLGTLAAVEAAIQGVQQGLSYYINLNANTMGGYQPGNFVVTVDDGTGTPPTGLLTNVALAIDNVRAATETFAVLAPAITSVAIACTITTAAGVNHTAATISVANAITTYVDAIPVGSPLPYSILAGLAYGALPAGQITNVTGLTVNSGTADIAVAATGVIKVSSVTVS